MRNILRGRRRERMVGSARQKRQYDLPLDKGTGTGFLVLLVGLMTFLAVMALGASFALSALQSRWTSGLENRVTVEIPAEHDGRLLSADEVTRAAEKIQALLENYPAVAHAEILPAADIRALVSPWLGDGALPDDMPLPALISVTLERDSEVNMAVMQDKITALVPQARLDTHESWLRDVLRFAGALKGAAFLLLLTIGITTITAIAGAVRARMEIYRAEVELLHLMGATDRYIARQFQRYAFLAALQGGTTGLVGGGLAIGVIGLMAGRMDMGLLPDFSLHAPHIVMLAALPLTAALIGMTTARRTVMRVLVSLP